MTDTVWKPFPITDIFLIRNTGSVPAKDIAPDSGSVPYVTAQAGNNGVRSLIDCPTNCLEIGHCILIGGKTMTFSYQAVPFCSNDSHNIALYPQGKQLDEAHFLFLVSALRATLRPKYSWSDSISAKRIKKESVMLPMSENGSPDWEYMGDFMKSIMKTADAQISALTETTASYSILDSSEWARFKIEDLFVVQKGTRLTRADMIPGGIPFIGATLENNGVTAHIGNAEHIHPSGVMTVAYNGQKATGKAFWQPKPFWASDDVNVLYPKFDLTEEIALFLQPLFWEAGRPYAYDDKWSKEKMERTELTLPAKSDGNPDWEYMKEYMEGLEQSASNIIDVLNEV